MLSLVVKQIGSHQCWALNITRLWNIDGLFMHFCELKSRGRTNAARETATAPKSKN